ncbi:MAG: hypothetical protein WB424_05395 [Terracidiphilus sp.]
MQGKLENPALTLRTIGASNPEGVEKPSIAPRLQQPLMTPRQHPQEKNGKRIWIK